MSDFGNVVSPNLECITSKLGLVLRIYENLLGNNVKFGNYPPLHIVPNKAYAARTIIPVNYGGMKKGDLYVLLFKPGDGTGNEDYFTKDDLVIPSELVFRDRPERVFPRFKEGILVEAFLPFFSIYNNSLYINHVCLEELIVDDKDGSKSVVNFGYLGSSPEDYRKNLRNGTQSLSHPFVQMTVGSTRFGERFGDPNAIYCPKDFVALQVAGFLAIKEKDNPLAKIIDKLAKTPW